jgi:hypothetical protein
MSEPLPPVEIERREAQILYVYGRRVKLFVRRLLWERLDDDFIRQRVYRMVAIGHGTDDEREIRERLKDAALVALEETLAEPNIRCQPNLVRKKRRESFLAPAGRKGM